MDYTLVENPLKDAAGNYRAQVMNVKSYTQSDIIDLIMEIGAGLTRSDITSVFEAEKQVITKLASEGSALTTPLYNVSPSMQGVFDHAGDGYDPSRHRVRINLQPGTVLREAAERIRPRKVKATPQGTMIISVLDVKSGILNSRAMQGYNLRINGSKLKIAGTHADVGVWFVQDNGTALKVDPSDVVTNNPSELVIVVPAMLPGEYRLKVVTQYSGSNLLKVPRSTVFDKLLTVS